MRKNKNAIKEAREEGAKLWKEGRDSNDNESCKKELNGVISIEWAANADKPGYKAKKLFRSPQREQFLKRCVYQGKGDVPHYGYEHDPEMVRARLVHEGFKGSLGNVDPEDVVKELKRRAKAFIKIEGSDDNCQKTVRSMLDVEATLGKQYGLNDDRKVGSLLDEVRELERNAVGRCVVPIPKDNPHKEERVGVSRRKPWEPQEEYSGGYREIELYGTRVKKSKKRRRR